MMKFYNVKISSANRLYDGVSWPSFGEVNHPRTGEFVVGKHPSGEMVTVQVTKITHRAETDTMWNSTHIIEIEVC